jgi:hypothetical protein
MVKKKKTIKRMRIKSDMTKKNQRRMKLQKKKSILKNYLK